jgi:hypothetical protein
MSGTANTGTTTVPVVIGPTGRLPTPPAVLNAEIIANATAQAPGLTILPAGLIEDVSSTSTGAATLIDQAVTETIASLSPYGANAYLLTELGQIYLGQGSTNIPATNTSVYVVFSGTVNFPIGPGFIVSDGTNQYALTVGGIVGQAGFSQPIFAQALLAGSFAVPANTVTTIVTSIPTGVVLTVTNPAAGTPATAAQTEAQYRAQVLQAGLVGAVGMPFYLKTLLQAVPGVVATLISIRSQPGPLWEIIVGGTGDPFAIGNAIFQGVGAALNQLVGSTLAVTAVSIANPAVVTTNLNHLFSTGQVVIITGLLGSAAITGLNGVSLTITVLTQTTFSVGFSTLGGTYTSGGVVTPNLRNTTVTINSYPDSYTIPIVLPPVQTVTLTVTYNTSSLNFVNQATVAALAQPALAAYVNAIPVGAPINILELTAAFQEAVVSVIPTVLLTRLVFAVTINGVVSTVATGTETIFGDPESYFSISSGAIIVVQG